MTGFSGYRSENVGKQELSGSAVERIESATDTNSSAKVDNEQWYSRLLRFRKRLDRLHERVFAD
jgi:hypothetical protein